MENFQNMMLQFLTLTMIKNDIKNKIKKNLIYFKKEFNKLNKKIFFYKMSLVKNGYHQNYLFIQQRKSLYLKMNLENSILILFSLNQKPMHMHNYFKKYRSGNLSYTKII